MNKIVFVAIFAIIVATVHFQADALKCFKGDEKTVEASKMRESWSTDSFPSVECAKAEDRCLSMAWKDGTNLKVVKNCHKSADDIPHLCAKADENCALIYCKDDLCNSAASTTAMFLLISSIVSFLVARNLF